MMGFNVVCAVAIQDGAIGVTRDGVPGLPWPTLKRDMLLFRALTCSSDPQYVAEVACTEPLLWGVREPVSKGGRMNSVIMGRRTWESLGCKQLQHRHNIVLSTASVVQWQPPDTMFTSKLDYALDLAKRLDAPHTFVIGGASLYAEALRHPGFERLYLTEVDAAYPKADTHWPYDMSLWNWELGACCDRGDLPWLERTACSAWVTEPERHWYRFSVWGRV